MTPKNACGKFIHVIGVFGFFVKGHYHHNHRHFRAQDEHYHRTADSLASDFSASGRADVFDSCLIACYGDIVSRYGKEFAEYLRSDGFVFESCPGEDANTTYTYTADSRQKQRNLNRILGATNQLNKLWTTRGTDGKLHVPFRVKPTSAFDQETLDTIALALEHIEDATGVIKFIDRTDEQEYVYFSYEVSFYPDQFAEIFPMTTLSDVTSFNAVLINLQTYYANICASNLGKQTNTSTKIYLGWCRAKKYKGAIIHEILHALGFWHEHSRPDRDNFIKIEWNNVLEGAERNLEKAEEVNSLGSEYDYLSIMHYPGGAYAIDSSKPTIMNTTVMNKWETIGQRVKLSDRDVDQLRLLYQCKSGPRHNSVGVDELCSKDCPCWEYAHGECDSDEECMGDLVCGNAPDTLPIQEYYDQLP